MEKKMLKKFFYVLTLATLASTGSYADDTVPGTDPVIIPQEQQLTMCELPKDQDADQEGTLACGGCKKRSKRKMQFCFSKTMKIKIKIKMAL